MRIIADPVSVLGNDGTVYGPFGGWADAWAFCKHLGLPADAALVMRDPALWPDGFDAEALAYA